MTKTINPTQEVLNDATPEFVRLIFAIMRYYSAPDNEPTILVRQKASRPSRAKLEFATDENGTHRVTMHANGYTLVTIPYTPPRGEAPESWQLLEALDRYTPEMYQTEADSRLRPITERWIDAFYRDDRHKDNRPTRR